MACPRDANKPLAIADNTAPEKTFDFFSLARELRDAIYDKILTGTKLSIDQEQRYLEVNACNVPRLRHLLVNRQFRSELLERSRKCAYIEIRQKQIILCPNTPSIPSVLAFKHFHIHFEFDNAFDPPQEDDDLIRNLMSIMDAVRENSVPFEIDFYIPKGPPVAQCIDFLERDLESILDELTKSLLTRLQLWQWQGPWWQRGEIEATLLTTREGYYRDKSDGEGEHLNGLTREAGDSDKADSGDVGETGIDHATKHVDVQEEL